MSAPNSRKELIDYCLRKLGYPVIEINVDDDQIEDRIDEALQFYQEYHSDAVTKAYLKYQITQDDLLHRFIKIPNSVTTVQRVLPIGHAQGDILFNIQGQIKMNSILDMNTYGNNGSMTSYYLTNQYMSTMNTLFNGHDPIRFNRHTNRLHIDTKWEANLPVDSWIIIEAHVMVNPDTFTDVYNDMFLKKYATALIKKQWGQNMSKFSNMVLPGGVQIDAQGIISEANEEIREIEEKMQLNYEYPPEFMIG